jgi:putative transposase
MSTKYKSNNNIVYSCKYHIVWCSKYRRKVLVDEVELRLKEIIASVCEEKEVELLEMEVMPEHVHLLLDVDPQYGIHRVVKALKGQSSRELRKEFSHLTTKLPTLWSNSYFVSTSGGAPLEQIKAYIQSQKTYEKGAKHATDSSNETDS